MLLFRLLHLSGYGLWTPRGPGRSPSRAPSDWAQHPAIGIWCAVAICS